MSAKVDIILLEDVGKLGTAGDIISISEGYARNFLFPQGKAALADAGTKARIAEQTKQTAKQADNELADAQQQATKIEDVELFFDAKIKDGDEIFGTISAGQIAKQLATETKITLNPKNIELVDKITTTGTHEVTAKLDSQVEARFKVTVQGETKEDTSGE